MATNMTSSFSETITLFFAKLGSDADVSVVYNALGQIVKQGADYGTHSAMFGKLNLGTTIGFAFMGICPFYKALADKSSRKAFFIINCIGLIISCFLTGFSHFIFSMANGNSAIETLAIATYIIGNSFIIFFTIQDIQMLYVFETISEKKRALVYGLAKGVGTLGSVLVLVIKLFFVTEGKGLSLNIVLYLIAGFGLATLLIAILFLRESDPFVKQKIKELEIPLEEREKKRIEAKNSKFGLVNGIKLCFKNKNLDIYVFPYF